MAGEDVELISLTRFTMLWTWWARSTLRPISPFSYKDRFSSYRDTDYKDKWSWGRLIFITWIHIVIIDTTTSLHLDGPKLCRKCTCYFLIQLLVTPQPVWVWEILSMLSYCSLQDKDLGLMDVRSSKLSKLGGSFNSLRPSDAIWRHTSGSTLAQVMACCLTAPSHYLNQCWLIIRQV